MKREGIDDPLPDAKFKRAASSRREGRLPLGWKGRALLGAWAIVLAVWIQFAFASLEELEPQAASLGGIVVAILLAGGAIVWLAKLETDRDER